MIDCLNAYLDRSGELPDSFLDLVLDVASKVSGVEERALARRATEHAGALDWALRDMAFIISEGMDDESEFNHSAELASAHAVLLRDCLEQLSDQRGIRVLFSTVGNGDEVEAVGAEPGQAIEDETTQPLDSVNLSPAIAKVGREYNQVVDLLDEANPTDRDVYNSLASTYEDARSRGMGDVPELTTFDTWSRNLRRWREATNQSKYKKAKDQPPTGRSIVRSEDL